MFFSPCVLSAKAFIILRTWILWAMVCLFLLYVYSAWQSQILFCCIEVNNENKNRNKNSKIWSWVNGQTKHSFLLKEQKVNLYWQQGMRKQKFTQNSLPFPTDTYICIKKGGRMERFTQENTIISLPTAINLQRCL